MALLENRIAALTCPDGESGLPQQIYLHELSFGYGADTQNRVCEMAFRIYKRSPASI